MPPPPHKLRVLVLTKGLGRGGAEQIIVSTAAHLPPDRYQTEVAYVLPHKDALVDTLTARGVPVHGLGGGRLTWIVHLRRLLRTGRYDLVHTHMPVAAAAARLLAPRSTAFVHTEHNLWQRYHPLTRWANALTYRRNGAVLAVSTAVSDSVDRRWLGRSRLQVLQHGVDHEGLLPLPGARERARALLGLATTASVVGTVANLTAKKDQHTLLTAFAEVRRALPDAVLVVVGTGPLESALLDQARECGLTDAVQWLGLRDDVPALLPAFDAFCLSSLHEGLPISLLEAMACGVAAVSTAVGGVSEVIRDGDSGRLVPPSDPGALAAALIAVLTDEGLRRRLAKSGQDRSRDFGARQATENIATVYEQIRAGAR